MDEGGVESESNPPYFLSKKDFVVGVVVDVDGSAYFFIISDRLGVGVDSPSSPLRLKNDGVVDGVSKLFASAGAAKGDVLLGGTSGTVELLPVIGDTSDGALSAGGVSPVSRASFS